MTKKTESRVAGGWLLGNRRDTVSKGVVERMEVVVVVARKAIGKRREKVGKRESASKDRGWFSEGSRGSLRQKGADTFSDKFSAEGLLRGIDEDARNEGYQARRREIERERGRDRGEGWRREDPLAIVKKRRSVEVRFRWWKREGHRKDGIQCAKTVCGEDEERKREDTGTKERGFAVREN